MTGALMNHLWQSTIFAIAAGLLTLAFRKNQAKVRYWLWLSASLKFFVPFCLLIGIGSHLEWAPAAQNVAAQVAGPAISFTVEQIGEPFARSGAQSGFAPGDTNRLPVVILVTWLCGLLTLASIRSHAWFCIRKALRASTPAALPARLEVRLSRGLVEPGVVGVFRPILLLPEGIAERLTPPELEAVLTHEMCHVRRLDNLSALLHMIVESVFWFHPLVWWIGARLVEERERACDEEVLRLGNQASVYADAILHVCKLYLESPLACVPGVAGSDVRSRIETIMSNRSVRGLNRAKKFLLAGAGLAAVGAPVAIGIVVSPGPVAVGRAQAAAQSPASLGAVTPAHFGVVSIKPTGATTAEKTFHLAPDGSLRAGNYSLKDLIRLGWEVRNFQILGGPNWLDDERYDVEAKPETPFVAHSPEGFKTLGAMVQSLLAERFLLKIHHQTREMPVYYLVVAKGGPKLDRTGDAIDPSTQMRDREGQMWATKFNMTLLAEYLGGELERAVIDKTGLSGVYDFMLKWTPDDKKTKAPEFGISIFTALQEQLGLKLESGKGPVEMVIIDAAEKASPN